jgi:hypothetical protein
MDIYIYGDAIGEKIRRDAAGGLRPHTRGNNKKQNRGHHTPREKMPKRRMKATHNNGGYSTAFIAAEAQRGDAFD